MAPPPHRSRRSLPERAGPKSGSKNNSKASEESWLNSLARRPPPSRGSLSRSSTTVAEQRDKLAIIAAGGQARKYLGKSLSVEEIDKMDDDEVRKIYTRYEARLGVCMTKTLGKAALQLYTTVATMFLPIAPENRQPLMEDLESDLIVDRVLNSTACELYYRYGNLLAPITVALTTAGGDLDMGGQLVRGLPRDLRPYKCDEATSWNQVVRTAADAFEAAVDRRKPMITVWAVQKRSMLDNRYEWSFGSDAARGLADGGYPMMAAGRVLRMGLSTTAPHNLISAALVNI